ncbi:hypothetical protein [Lactobacillus paragasseri]|uniref:hypothetical protein n=1 Tax=Lactobacillus paragasseri TaxID=2107999 RepID=UPI00237F022B|nr:hypothetical protein [Lactobacillus paragasseri]MDE3334935.1 hypothetical protein [Lactobacillus paragasseri]MDE3398499.1 hypothetical protein [Lactobacillus paragasseri]
MKLLINIILVLIVLAGFGGMIYLSVNGNRFLGAAGLAMLYFVGSIGYFVNCYTIKKRAEFNRRDPKDLFYFYFLYYT